MGGAISIQNEHGNKQLRWDNTGTIVEVAAFDKYMIKVVGSGQRADNQEQEAPAPNPPLHGGYLQTKHKGQH